MNVSVLSVFPELYTAFMQTSLIKKAQENRIISVDLVSLFSFVEPKKRIDAPVCGPGSGMLLKPTIIEAAVDAQEQKHGKAYKIMFSPHGKTLDQREVVRLANRLSSCEHVMLLPARYEGMDARVESEYADEIISIGDYVLMGGDIPAMVFLEAVLRLIPGVVGKRESVEDDSFSGPFVDYPEYTEPLEWRGRVVPEIVKSGNHGAITHWRKEQALERTLKGHFDWLRSSMLSTEDKKQTLKAIPPHYVALMHGQVLVGKERMPGCTSVTSVDIHDIARSGRTYGIENYFIVTPLIDQQKIVNKFLSFWNHGQGERYNKNRYDAVRRVIVKEDLAAAVQVIEEKEGRKPLIISTSAQLMDPTKTIRYYDQGLVWQHDRPVLILFGTGQGLDPSVIDMSDYVLGPVEGLADFNHLSVRSAAAIILDRWLGLNKK
jgi:tRNA (guanine37-N1)-methyltransferase